MPSDIRALFSAVPNPERDEVTGLFPQSKSTGGSGEASRNYKSDGHTISASCQATGGFGDSGSAARFFKQCEFRA